MKNNSQNLWQSPLWEKFQNKLGRKTWFFNDSQNSALVIRHKLFCGFTWLDIPRGPIGSLEILNKIIPQLKKEEPKAVFMRIMPNLEFKIQNQKSKILIVPAHANHQPETTLKIDLIQTEDEILTQMKPKGRYNINLASKKGVKIYTSQKAVDFYNLLQETTNRDGFLGHSVDFYQKMLDSLGDKIQLLLAEYENKIIAGGIFVYTKTEAIYYYGASSNQYRNVMAPYLLQWKAIQEAKKRGCLWYDFLGIAPENAPQNHPWKGVSEFKKKFGGKIVNYLPAQEIILRPFLYKILILIKKIKKTGK